MYPDLAADSGTLNLDIDLDIHQTVQKSDPQTDGKTVTEAGTEQNKDTLMSDNTGKLLGPRQTVHSQTVVPVSTKKQQLCIRRYGKQL